MRGGKPPRHVGKNVGLRYVKKSIPTVKNG